MVLGDLVVAATIYCSTTWRPHQDVLAPPNSNGEKLDTASTLFTNQLHSSSLVHCPAAGAFDCSWPLHPRFAVFARVWVHK